MAYFIYLRKFLVKQTNLWLLLLSASSLLFGLYLIIILVLSYKSNQTKVNDEIIIANALYYLDLFYYLIITMIIGYLIYHLQQKLQTEQYRLNTIIKNYSLISMLVAKIVTLLFLIVIFNLFVYFVLLNLATLVNIGLLPVLNQKLWNSLNYGLLYSFFVLSVLLFFSNFLKQKWFKSLVVLLIFFTFVPSVSNILLIKWDTIINSENLIAGYDSQSLRQFKFQLMTSANCRFEKTDNFYKPDVSNWKITFINSDFQDFDSYLTNLIMQHNSFTALAQSLKTTEIIIQNVEYSWQNEADNLIKNDFYLTDPDIILTENQTYVSQSNLAFFNKIDAKLRFEMAQFPNFAKPSLIRLKNDNYSQNHFLSNLGAYFQSKYHNIIDANQVKSLVTIFSDTYLVNNSYARHLLLTDFEILYHHNLISNHAIQATKLLLEKKWLNRLFFSNQFIQSALSNFKSKTFLKNQILISNLNLSNYKIIYNQTTRNYQLWLQPATKFFCDVNKIYVFIIYFSIAIILLIVCTYFLI